MTSQRTPAIRRLEEADLAAAADVIRRSFATVAEEFGLTEDNCPGHTSFISVERLAAQFARGWLMYGLEDGGRLVGHVALTIDCGVCEIHNLAVLPDCRHRQLGRRLLDFCKDVATGCGASEISLSIMEENGPLRAWYLAHGFAHTGTARFAHLPFTVGRLVWRPTDQRPTF